MICREGVWAHIMKAYRLFLSSDKQKHKWRCSQKKKSKRGLWSSWMTFCKKVWCMVWIRTLMVPKADACKSLKLYKLVTLKCIPNTPRHVILITILTKYIFKQWATEATLGIYLLGVLHSIEYVSYFLFFSFRLFVSLFSRYGFII